MKKAAVILIFVLAAALLSGCLGGLPAPLETNTEEEFKEEESVPDADSTSKKQYSNAVTVGDGAEVALVWLPEDCAVGVYDAESKALITKLDCSDVESDAFEEDILLETGDYNGDGLIDIRVPMKGGEYFYFMYDAKTGGFVSKGGGNHLSGDPKNTPQ